MEKEIWQILLNSPNYQVSNFGRIKNKAGKLKKENKRYTDGYGLPKRAEVGIIINGKMRTTPIHRLVAMAFLPPKPTALHTIDHIDRNPFNNHASNLRWATKKEQMDNRRSYRKGSLKKLTMLDIEVIYQKTKTLSLLDVSKEYDIPHSSLHKIMRYVHPDY